MPWAAPCALIEPFYPKPGNGRPPIGVERMLRLYFLQQWFNLSDRAVEEALYCVSSDLIRQCSWFSEAGAGGRDAVLTKSRDRGPPFGVRRPR